MTDSSKFGALGAVLARNLEDIADLAEYVAPPPGVYSLLISSVAQKEINDKTAIVVEYDILDCGDVVVLCCDWVKLGATYDRGVFGCFTYGPGLEFADFFT